MGYFVQQLVTGLAAGGTYALVAIGFVLVFGVSNILNIAHGETVMLAPAFFILCVQSLHVGIVPAAVLAVAATVACGLLIHTLGVRPFLRKGLESEYLAPLIATFGISLLIEHGMSLLFGTQPRSFPIEIPRAVWRVGSIAFVPMQVIGLLLAAALVLALALVVTRTDFGRAMRAVAENAAVAETLGIGAARTTYVTTAVAAALGATAGLLFAAGTNSVSAFMGTEYGLKGLVVMIVGGVTSLPGAVPAGVLLGVVESLVTGFISSSYSNVITFGILVVVLLLKPQGLFASASREARP